MLGEVVHRIEPLAKPARRHFDFDRMRMVAGERLFGWSSFVAHQQLSLAGPRFMERRDRQIYEEEMQRLGVSFHISHNHPNRLAGRDAGRYTEAFCWRHGEPKCHLPPRRAEPRHKNTQQLQ